MAKLNKTPGFRLAKRIALGLTVIELVYVLAVNALLLSGALQKLVNDTRTAHLEIGSCYTLIPTHVHASDLRFRYEDHNIQMGFSIDAVDVTVRALWLFKKRFSASKVRAEGVSFLFRHKLARVEGNEQALALYPEIAGFSDPPLLGIPKQSNPDDLWSFQLDDVNAHIQELWFMTYRYLGPAQATGGFQLVPYRNLEVGPARLDLYSGALHSGKDDVLSFDLHGSVDLHLVPVNPESLTGMATFAPISATVCLTTRLENLQPINLYLPEAAGIHATGGRSDLEVAAQLVNGRLAPGSTLSCSPLAPFRIENATLAAQGPMTWKLGVAADWSAQLSWQAQRIEFFSPTVEAASSAPVAIIERAESNADLDGVDLTKPLTLARAHLAIPVLDFDHLERIGRALPEKSSWQLLGGSAKFSGSADFQNDSLTEAEVKGDFAAAQFKLKEHEAWAYGSVDLDYAADRSDRSARLNRAEVRFNNVTVRSKERRTPDWWASLSADRLELAGAKPLSGVVVVRAKNADPVLNALDVPGVLRVLIPNKPVEALARIEKRGEGMHLGLIRAQTGNLNVSGGLQRELNRTTGAFRVTGIAIPFGIEFDRDESGLTLFASKNWLDQHLQALGMPMRSTALSNR